MPKKPLEANKEQFSKVTDPGMDRTKEHKLIDMIVIAICATICGAEGWTDIENFGNSKLPWLKTFLELSNGIPSPDTLGRVFSMLDAKQFQVAFYEGMIEMKTLQSYATWRSTCSNRRNLPKVASMPNNSKLPGRQNISVKSSLLEFRCDYPGY